MGTVPGRNIIIVHDRDFLLASLADCLVQQGFQVREARKPKEALALIEKAPPDLIILDVAGLGRQGLSFLNSLSTGPGQLKYPVIVFTDRREIEQICLAAGVAEFLPKSAFGPELGQKILNVFTTSERDEKIAERGERRAVLLGEDDPAVAYMIRKAFQASGFHVYVAVDGRHLLTMSMSLRPDAVVTKEYLPKLNGSAAAARIAQMMDIRYMPVILYDETQLGDTSRSPTRRVHEGVTEFLATRQGAVLVEAVTRHLPGMRE